MKKLQLAVVGCGDISGFTALASRLVRQIELAACVDINQERAEHFAKRHHIPRVFTDYQDVLRIGAIDAVYLAVPHYLHYEMILAAHAAKKHILTEKPLTRTLEEGKKLAELDTRVKIGVNYQYRYDRACYALTRAVQAGELGKVHSVRINVPWHRSVEYFNEAPWHKTIAQAGGGTLITQGSHFLDVVLSALNDRVISAMGYTRTPLFDVEVDTLTHGIVETIHGTLINISSSMATASEQPVTIEVYGERGTAIYRGADIFPSVKFIGVKVNKQRPPMWGVHALQKSLAGFAHWIFDDTPYLTPLSDSIPVLEAVDAIYRSAESGKREWIPEQDCKNLAFTPSFTERN